MFCTIYDLNHSSGNQFPNSFYSGQDEIEIAIFMNLSKLPPSASSLWHNGSSKSGNLQNKIQSQETKFPTNFDSGQCSGRDSENGGDREGREHARVEVAYQL